MRKIFDNITDIVRNNLKGTIPCGSKVSIAAALKSKGVNSTFQGSAGRQACMERHRKSSCAMEWPSRFLPESVLTGLGAKLFLSNMETLSKMETYLFAGKESRKGYRRIAQRNVEDID